LSQHESVAAWRKSSRCDSNHCVEVAHRDNGVAVRDNTRPETHLSFDNRSWHGLVRAIRSGELSR
jgi:hypothetical protein